MLYFVWINSEAEKRRFKKMDAAELFI